MDIRPGDVAVWPTNLGWMMGTWLIYQLAGRLLRTNTRPTLILLLLLLRASV
jgi:hypothetical protein